MRHHAVVAFWFSLAIVLFLILLQPLGLSRFRHLYKNWLLLGLGTVCFAATLGNVLLVPRLWRRPFDPERWSVGRELLWNAWLFSTAVLVSAVYWARAVGLQITLTYLLYYFLYGLLITAFFMPTCVLLNYQHLLKKRLREAESLNRRLRGAAAAPEGERVVLSSESGREKLEVPPERLLYIQSADNYANVVCRRNGALREKLLRTSLKNLEGQLPQYLVRCHRSFIVNLKRVRKVTGNARHYTLWLEGCDRPVPVSRELEKPVLARLRALQGD